jgi:hypothetical protein
VNPVLRRLVLTYSVRNRHKKVRSITEFMTAHGLRTVIVVGVAGDSDQPNEDIVEHALTRSAEVVAAISHVPVQTSLPLVIADGRALPFGSGTVDLVLSNAVVEHVGGEAEQQRFVDEHVRVGRAWYVTTPNRWFPMESHTSVLLKHWSAAWRAQHVEEFTRLLSRREFRALLPPGAHVTGRPWSPTFTAYGLS